MADVFEIGADFQGCQESEAHWKALARDCLLLSRITRVHRFATRDRVKEWAALARDVKARVEANMVLTLKTVVKASERPLGELSASDRDIALFDQSPF